jgi:serine/threonine protein kinase
MEIVEGGTLVDWLEVHGAMPPRLAVDVMIQTCEGIHAAHLKGVIHRDIKPHNVMIGTDGVCRITDFGIARVGDTDASLTKTGAVMGTWGYMAPEQRTNAKTVDARADVYALGASLYTLLTNKLPMDLFAADRDASMMAGIQLELVDLLLKATDYAKDRRYANCLELVEALKAVRPLLPENPADMPPLAREPGAPPPVPRVEDYVGGVNGHTLLPEDQSGVHGVQHAYTMPPSEGAPLAGGPQQDRALYAPGPGFGIDPSRHATPSPAPSRESRSSGGGFRIVGWMMAGVFAMAGMGMIGVAAAIVFLGAGTTTTAGPPTISADPVAAVADPTPDPQTDPPPSDPIPPADLAKAPADPAPATKTPKTPKTTSSPKSDPPKVATETPKTETPPPAETPQVVVKVEQCLKVTPPARAVVGSDVVFKAALCSEDGTEVTLWYRAVGGTWQSKLMPKALGAHTAKIPVDESYRSGLEFYVVAGSTAQGSAGQPLRVGVE